MDAYLRRSTRWPEEIAALRPLLTEPGLTEELKWGKPCYTHDGSNIAIVQEMKAFLALMFFKGALVDDPDGVLEPQGRNSRSAMRICFRSVGDVERLAGTVTRLVGQAIEVEEAGLEIGPAPEPVLVDELLARFEADATFETAFRSLTPGRQREYNLYFSDAKQVATRNGRIERCADKIRAGKGLRDR
ncbi:MAG: YdeI/OmpD-associated family protein [Desertimonas sp.]